jgi:hypothetical protein
MITGAAMLSTVGLDDEPCFDTSKVIYIRRYRMLASEAPAELVLPEHIPKEPLRFRRAPTQTASASDHRGTASHYPESPSAAQKLPQLCDRGKSGEPPP